MHRSFMILAVGTVAATLLAIAAATFWYERPAKLTVAISRADADDRSLIETAAHLLKFGRNAVRLQIRTVDSAAAASAAVDGGTADLAVIRTDVAVPSDAQTVVILHRDSALLVTPGSSGIKDVGDLAGHTIGILRRGAGNDHFITTTLGQYDMAPDSVTLANVTQDSITEALKAKTVDAILAVDVISSPRLRAVVKAVAAADDGTPVFIPIAEAEAIAQRSPVYEKTEVVRGAFGGSPPRPAEEYDTLSITHRLVANENIAQDLVGNLTRFFLTEKRQMAATAPLALQIEAPSTDKGVGLPVHAGSAAYIDDDEQTFFDKYSDFIYIGAMMMGVLASGATAVLGRINSRKTASLETSVGRLVEMLSVIRTAPSQACLDDMQAEADAMMAAALSAATAGGSDDRRLAVFTLALDQVRAAVRDRRAQLLAAPGLLPRAAE